MLTNGGEVGAFFVARAIVVAILYFVNTMLLAALYAQAYRSGGAWGSMAMSLAVVFVSWVVTFWLFVALRAGFGGVPPMIAADRNAATTSGGEIGAFFLAYVAVTVIMGAVTSWGIAGVYMWLRRNGHAELSILVSLGVSLVSALIFLPVFIGLRGAIAGSSRVPGAYPPPR